MQDDPREVKLNQVITQLRAEAESVKDCFTRFSFQALALSALVLGVIAQFQSDNPHVAFASILVIILVLAVARIGNYKYATANRHFGYQLHLERTNTFIFHEKTAWQGWMRYVGWEEAMRAWRVVQATVFEELYETGWLRANRLKNHVKYQPYKWFMPSSLVEPATTYYSGSYLRAMHTLLNVVAVASLIPLVVMVAQYRFYEEFREDARYFWLGVVVSIFAVAGVTFRIWKNNCRRLVLEDGLLCIHSCAIMWQAVIIAHYRALSSAFVTNGSLKGYTKHLSREAHSVATCVFDLHDWIRDPG
jgi:hypothetical protein